MSERPEIPLDKNASFRADVNRNLEKRHESNPTICSNILYIIVLLDISYKDAISVSMIVEEGGVFRLCIPFWTYSVGEIGSPAPYITSCVM